MRFPCLLASLALIAPMAAAPTVIDDQALLQGLEEALVAQIGKEGLPSADTLAATAKKGPLPPTPIALPGTGARGPTGYEELSRSVYLIGTVYKCGKCDKWHRGGGATAWCLSDDGLMVTNAHVFVNARGPVMGVTDREGRCHPVTALVAIDRISDIALFRVKGEGLRPLRLGRTAEVGDPITIISHPSGNHFLETSGKVARYVRRAMDQAREKATWMNVTADYAKGSSGGPVFNAKGEVVGMVSSTLSLYTEPTRPDTAPKGHLQMVIKQCVPVEAIHALLAPASTAPKSKAQAKASE